MVSLGEVNTRFIQDMFEASKLITNNVFSVIPSILFLTSIFAWLYSQFHENTNSFTRWKTKLFKDIVFHWTYFYTSRIWFVFLKLCRWIIRYTDRLIERNSSSDEAYINKVLTHFCFFLLVLSISLVPCLLLSVRYLHRREMPNFLIWVAEDPWSGSEIGTSGHYLERPPQAGIHCPYKQIASYRSGRSSSVDSNVFWQKETNLFRSKSM